MEILGQLKDGIKQKEEIMMPGGKFGIKYSSVRRHGKKVSRYLLICEKKIDICRLEGRLNSKLLSLQVRVYYVIM